jgi:hypothetical protein
MLMIVFRRPDYQQRFAMYLPNGRANLEHSQNGPQKTRRNVDVERINGFVYQAGQILKAVGWMYKVRFKGEYLVLLFSEPKYMVPWLIHWSP